MRIIIKILEFPFKILMIFFVYLYKFCISPLLPNNCRFYPTCSTYAILALKEFGFFKGTTLAIKRILRCNPRSKCGFDPIPNNIKGDFKWLI